MSILNGCQDYKSGFKSPKDAHCQRLVVLCQRHSIKGAVSYFIGHTISDYMFLLNSLFQYLWLTVPQTA